MWRPAYKQRCVICKKNMVLIQYPKQRPNCQECQAKSFSAPITDPKFQKMFAIDPKLYDQSSFLRDIRFQYGRFQSLSERQIQTFQRVVKEITEKAKELKDGAGAKNKKSPSNKGGPLDFRPSRPARNSSNPLR